MPSLRTVYRAIVMIATGVIVVKGWQLYGPSTEQVKTIAVTAMEKVQASWNESQQGTTDAASPAGDPRAAAPPLVAEQSSAVVDPEPISAAPKLVPLVNAGENTPYGAGEAVLTAPAPLAPALEADGLAPLLTRLQAMGGADAQVAPWGSSGQLYRCCCRAKLSETSVLARHFEAVASEPVAAVEQVVAKVEAWRTEQQTLLR
ncbi:MAG: hypothetical protein L0228_10525 [Planctomycetes bacterium]|nr:hypothetical protein [Planctomycetota bacterium]